MKKVLLLPSDHGGGRGHVSRMLYLAEKLRRHGFMPGLVLEKKHFQSGLGDMYERFLLDTRFERLVKYQARRPFKPGVHLKTRLRERPVYTAFNSLAYQIPRDGYWTTRLVRHRLKNLSRIVESFKPQVLIGDTHMLTALLGRMYDLPVVQVTRLQGYAPAPDFNWWGDEESVYQAPDGLKPFEPLLREWGMEAGRVEDLLRGARYLIPASADVEPLSVSRPDTFYCGPFNVSDRAEQPISFFDEPSDSPKIYISIGGGAGRAREKQFFESLIRLFDKSEYRVLVSTGNRLKAQNFNGRSANMLFTDWIHGPSAIAKSDAIVFHGGYGTMMETLTLRRPALVLPSHSEQWANGKRLESLAVGKVLPLWQRMETLELEWPFGRFTQGAGLGLQLDRESVLQALHDLIFSDAYERLERIAKPLREKQQEFDPRQLLDI